jgi:uncharacterized protein (UPF0332 family)
VSALIDALVRKSRRALRSARLELRDGDTDGAVNRSYNAMLNAAQAALLSAGIPEDKLPKTHSGLIAAFGQHVVKTGKVESEFGRSLNKTEGLRLRADYTGVEVDRPPHCVTKSVTGWGPPGNSGGSTERRRALRAIGGTRIRAASKISGSDTKRGAHCNSQWSHSGGRIPMGQV